MKTCIGPYGSPKTLHKGYGYNENLFLSSSRALKGHVLHSITFYSNSNTSLLLYVTNLPRRQPSSQHHGIVKRMKLQDSFSGTSSSTGPKHIVSDRDPRFTGKFWRELFRSQLHFSTSFHPQTERVNALVEMYLRHFVSANQSDLAKFLDIDQLSYNMQRSESTQRSPFEIVTGRQPLVPPSLVAGHNPSACKVAGDWAELDLNQRRHIANEFTVRPH